MYSYGMLGFSFVFFILSYVFIISGSITRRLSTLSYLSLFFYIFCLLVFFYNKPIISGDSLEYAIRYESGLEYYSNEIIFGWIDSFFKYFNVDSKTYVSFLSIICILSQLIAVFVIGYRNFIGMFFIFMANSFAILTWSGVYKQGLSASLVLISVYFLMLNKRAVSYFLIFIAILIHNSALLILISFVIYEIFKNRYYFLKFLCLLSYLTILINFLFGLTPLRDLVLFLLDILIPFMPDELSRGVRYFIVDFSDFNQESYEYLKATSRVSIDVFLQYSFFVFLFFFKPIKNSKESVFWASLYIISSLFYVLSIGQAFSYRFYIFSSFLYVCFVYYVFINFRYKEKILIVFISFLFYLACSYYSFPPEKIGLLYLNPLG